MNLRKEEFVYQLAKYLVNKQVNWSIKLQVDPDDPDARQWCDIRTQTPIFGYPTVDEAVETLTDWFGKDWMEKL
jgi:hypothetical protein